jgi:fido (protein-threonine AMPylation protein)
VDQIRRLPLNSDIHSLQDYEDAVISGTLDCVAFLRRIRPLDVLTVADFQQAHHQLFKRAHPWAGRFRTPGQMVTIAGLPAADAPRIARELELAWFQTRELIESAYSASNPQEMLAALAFLHVRFERVHPFLDGNGRVGRAILRVQMEKAFGIGPGFTDQTGYRTSLRASNRKDLAPLMNYLGVPIGLSMVNQPWIAPFQVAPRFLEDVSAAPTFEDDVAWSRL